MIKAYQEELISLDELRAGMPELRARETGLRGQLDAHKAQLVDRDAYLNLATGLEDFLARLRQNACTATVPEQQRLLRLLVKDVLIGPERILIRHSIPTTSSTTTSSTTIADSDADEEPSPSSRLRWRSHHPALRESPSVGASPLPGSTTPAFSQSRIRSLAGNDPTRRVGGRGRSCRTRRPGRHPGPMSAWSCPAGWRTRPGSRPGTRGPAGTHTIGTRTGPPIRAPAPPHSGLVPPVRDHRDAERARLGFSPAFGMYTRRTGDGLHELRVACTCTATSARAWLVNATSP